jgi:DNA-binding NarL/FixJ family response regulator
VIVLHKGYDWSDDTLGRILTKREVQIVRLVSHGLPNKVVAEELGVREGTVKIHLHSIYRKLHISSRTELILRVTPHGRKMPKFKRAAAS